MRIPGVMLWEVIRSLGRCPVTTGYPAVPSPQPPGFRGRIVYHARACIACRLCVKDCPTGAITVRQVVGKRFECEIDSSRCIYCAQCVDSCPRGALEATLDFQAAVLDRKELNRASLVDADEETGERP